MARRNIVHTSCAAFHAQIRTACIYTKWEEIRIALPRKKWRWEHYKKSVERADCLLRAKILHMASVEHFTTKSIQLLAHGLLEWIDAWVFLLLNATGLTSLIPLITADPRPCPLHRRRLLLAMEDTRLLGAEAPEGPDAGRLRALSPLPSARPPLLVPREAP